LIICWLGIKKGSSKCNGFPNEVCAFQNKLMAIKRTKMRKRKLSHEQESENPRRITFGKSSQA